MALQTTGAISFSDINDEFGKYTNEPISLGDTEVRNLFGQSSGSVSIDNAYNKTAPYFNINVTSTVAATYDLHTEAIAAGWNQAQKLSLTLDSNCWIQGGLKIDGSFPRPVKIINNGHISGIGGKGGDRGCWNHLSNYPYGNQHVEINATAGEPGGSGISVNCTKPGFPLGNPVAEGSVEIINNGTISGGGGGGGASAGQANLQQYAGQTSSYCNGQTYFFPRFFHYWYLGVPGGGGQGLYSAGGGPYVPNSGNIGLTNIYVEEVQWIFFNGSSCQFVANWTVRPHVAVTEGTGGSLTGVGSAGTGHVGTGGGGGTWGQAGSNGSTTYGGAGGRTIYVTTGEVTIDLNTGTYNGTTFGL